MAASARGIEYSEKYQDSTYEYRHVVVPKDLASQLPRGRLVQEEEWRRLGVQQSKGWQNYAIHKPEQNILLFRRPLGTHPLSGEVQPALQREAQQLYQQHLEANMRK